MIDRHIDYSLVLSSLHMIIESHMDDDSIKVVELIDNSIIDYIFNAIADTCESELTITIRELVCNFFAFISCDVTIDAIVSYFLLTSKLDQEELQQHESTEKTQIYNDIVNASIVDNTHDDIEDIVTETEEDPSLTSLKEAMGTVIDSDIIEYVYNIISNRNINEAGRTLGACFENPEETSKLRESMDEYDARVIEEQKLEAKQRAVMNGRVLQAFGEKIVLPKYDEKTGKEIKRSSVDGILMNVGMTDKNPCKIRYRDNSIATTKGEKVIIIKREIDSYDGGSRGIVKSKGKRGKGFY